jgi:hypothetical protein
VKRGGPWLFVTTDAQHGVALLRGDGAIQCARLFSGSYPSADSRLSRYSYGGGGWVIPSKLVPDVVAHCEHRHELVVVSNRRPPEQTGVAS